MLATLPRACSGLYFVRGLGGHWRNSQRDDSGGSRPLPTHKPMGHTHVTLSQRYVRCARGLEDSAAHRLPIDRARRVAGGVGSGPNTIADKVGGIRQSANSFSTGYGRARPTRSRPSMSLCHILTRKVRKSTNNKPSVSLCRIV
jgi:hypothetical protein